MNFDTDDETVFKTVIICQYYTARARKHITRAVLGAGFSRNVHGHYERC